MKYDSYPLVYVAGPITHPPGEMRPNAVKACRIAEDLFENRGCIPLVPHLSVFWAETMAEDRHEPGNGLWGYEQWLALDFAYIRRCDAVFRMEGYSPGADREVELAKEIGIPVFYDLNSIEKWALKRVGAHV